MDTENKSHIIVCKNCGKENNINSELCSECGTLLKDGLVICYISMWKRVFDFKGRSSRSEFIKAYISNAFLFAIVELLAYFILEFFHFDLEAILVLCPIVFIISQLAVASLTVRRLHDAGKSGCWELLSIIAVVGNIIIFIICCLLAAAIITVPMVQCVYGPPPES